ncbi:MAG: Na/Pi cotransporter family protein [Clostridia bacterium]
MQYVYMVFALLAGLGAFLIGVKLLSDNTEKLSTKGIRDLFKKTSNNKLVGVGIGVVVTSIIQSSSLTTVMVVGFVNAEIMSLSQAAAIIMGANIGTTITAQIAALQAFKFSAIAMGLTGIGIFIALLGKKDKIKSIGFGLAGLGLIFVGLAIMSDAMKIVKESPKIVQAFQSINNPFLLFFVGVALTALVQSSSAVTSIIISMATAGIVIGSGGNSVLYIILGTNIGTCVTALISSIGANINAKRAATIHLMFNVLGSLIFFIILISWRSFMDVTFGKWFAYPSTQIAMFHTAFNCICTLIFLPMSGLFVKFVNVAVKEKKSNIIENKSMLDKRFVSTPGIAVDISIKEIARLMENSIKSLDIAMKGFFDKSEDAKIEVDEINKKIGERGEEITKYLILVSSNELADKLESIISSLHSSIGDILRIGELSDNITKYTKYTVKGQLEFSDTVNTELKIMVETIHKLADKTKESMLGKDANLLGEIDKIEDSIDDMRKNLIKMHIDRLNQGQCKAESSSVFINLVSNLERVGDHLSYIGHYSEELNK